jgi:hypothetical protein
MDNVVWVTLNGSTAGEIPKDALLFQDPSIHLEEINNNGHPSSIDWTTSADWYNRDVHWRGFTPILDPNVKEIQLHSDNILPIVGQPSLYHIHFDIHSLWDSQINKLYSAVELLNKVLKITSSCVKFSVCLQPSTLWNQPGSQYKAMKKLAFLRRTFLDALGYFCWVRAVFKDKLETCNIPLIVDRLPAEWTPFLINQAIW